MRAILLALFACNLTGCVYVHVPNKLTYVSVLTNKTIGTATISDASATIGDVKGDQSKALGTAAPLIAPYLGR